ncbi:MAG TPA: phage holin family protein [Crocinitomicaceae bacterium]|nr:phage holin family protein [Crocinitomicaceae bacterium]
MNKIAMFWLAILGWLTPLYPFFILTGFAIVMDTFFGLKVSQKYKKVSSRKFSRVLYKLLMYNIIIISAYSIDIYLLGSFIGLFSSVELTATKAVVFGVLMVELISIDEKLIQLNGKGLRFYWQRVMNIIKKVNKERKSLTNE